MLKKIEILGKRILIRAVIFQCNLDIRKFNNNMFSKKVIKKGKQQLKGKVSLVLFFRILNPLF